MTTTAPLTVPRIHFSHPTDRERLAVAVLSSPRLLGSVPTAKLEELFRAYAAATRAAAKARSLPAPEEADAVADLEARLRAGDDIDPAVLVEELSAAQVARDNRQRTVAMLTSMPQRFSDEIVSVLVDHKGLYFEDLGDALDDLFDRAEETAAELGSADTADAAIDAGKAEAWSRLKGLAAEHASLRADHFALARIEDGLNIYNGSPAWAFAQYRGLADVLPDALARIRGESHDMLGRPVPLPLDVFDAGSVPLLLAVARDRARWSPYVGTPREAFAAMAEANADPNPSTPREPGRMTAAYGGERAFLRRELGTRASHITYGPRSED